MFFEHTNNNPIHKQGKKIVIVDKKIVTLPVYCIQNKYGVYNKDIIAFRNAEKITFYERKDNLKKNEEKPLEYKIVENRKGQKFIVILNIIKKKDDKAIIKKKKDQLRQFNVQI